MIVKHSADETPKPMPVGLRLARVISIGNGTVDVCPIGSSVVLHDIPVTSATTMEVGDVVNLQMMDNKRFAFASQNAVVSGESVAGNVTIQNGDVIIAGEGGTGTGTITGVTAGNGLTGGGTSGSVSINAVAGDGIVVSSDSIAVSSDVVRTSRSITAGNGLTGGGNLSADQTLSIALAATSGLNTTSGLAIGQGNGISVGASSVAVNQAYGFTWTSAHAFNSGFTAAASTFTGLLTGTSGAFSGAINVGTASGTGAGYLYTSGRIGVGKNSADYPLDVVGDIYSSASVRANTSVITQELTGAGASTSVSLTNGTGFKSSQYASGFAGNGWRIYRQNNTSKAEWEVDNLTVRGTLSVYELLIQQIRATNGSIFVSAAAKIESVSGTGPYTLIVEGGSSDYAPFAVGDVIRAQRVSLGTSTLVWQSDLTVTAINVGSNPRAFTATLQPGSTAPAEGMEYVRLGNTTDTNRQGVVYLTADDSGAPFIDIVNDVTSHANWGTAAKVKARIGRLNGIVGGATANYGIWSGTGTASTDSWVKMAEDGILLNNVPLKMYNSTLQTVDFAANGNLKIGTNVANASTTALSWNGTTLAIDGDITAQNGSIEGTLAVGTSGQILQGAGSVGSNFTGLRIWSDPWATTYTYTITATGGSFTMSYFDATTVATAYNATAATLQTNLRNLSTIGSTGVNVSKVGNVFTISLQPSILKPANTLSANGALLSGGAGTLAATVNTQIGKIAGYNRNIQQWFATTDGKIKTGAGKIAMTSDGILMESISNPSGVPTYSGTAGIKFSSNIDNPNSVYGVLYGENDGAGGYRTLLYNENIGATFISLEDTGLVSYHQVGAGTSWVKQILSDGSSGMSIEWFSNTLGSLGKYVFSTSEASFPSKLTVSGILEAQDTQLMRFKYGPSGFNDGNTYPYLEYTVTSNNGGFPYGSFLINFAGRSDGGDTTQELWYFQVYRNYQALHVLSSQRIAGTSNVFPRVIENTAGTSPSYSGTLTVRWWVGPVNTSYSDGLEITVTELSSGLSAGHRGTFSVGSTSTVTGTSFTSAQQGNMFAGTIIATDKITATNGAIVPASNNSAIFALDASSGTTASLGQGATYFPFSNANNFSGMIMITNTTNNAIGLYLVGSTSVSLISDTSGSTYTATSGTASRINLYLVNGAVVVQQNIAGTRVIRTVGVRMGTSA